MIPVRLARRTMDDIPVRRIAEEDDELLDEVRRIVDDVRERGEAALRRCAEQFDGLPSGAPIIVPRDELQRSLDDLSAEQRTVLERTASRIRRFAEAQRDSLRAFELSIPGGVARQRIVPVDAAGCYAPSGRYPLPSSVLMTAMTARTAGVEHVWVASPKPTPVTLAAAALSGADALLAAGGAQAIAALAYGVGDVPACDVIAGPGNRWVTAAKQLISSRGVARIDVLAGPSELLVIADDDADPAVIAADLLAQAEHDDDAMPMLIAMSEWFVSRVEAELAEQIESLPTRRTARRALENGFAVVVDSIDDAVNCADRIAAEHVQICVRQADSVASRIRHAGAIFVGERSAEVFGDYGAGPNHTLPTGGAARCSSGLIVFDFVRVRTELVIDGSAGSDELCRDAVALARMEGLEAHARAAERRAHVFVTDRT